MATGWSTTYQAHSDFVGNHNLPPYATRHFANLCGTGPGDGGYHGDNNIVEADTWHHLVYTSNWDGDAGQRTDNFYVDGVLAAIATSDDILNAHASLKFGQSRGNPYISGHQQFYGQLDQLEIYDTALTVNEVVTLFNDGSPPINLTWSADTSGDWSSAASWTPPGSPNAATHTAVFGNSTTGPTTAVLTSDVTVNRIEFNSPQPYAIAGLYSVSLEIDPDDPSDPSDAFGFPTLSATAGSHQVQANVNLQANTTADIAAGATLEFVNRLNLNDNTLTKSGDGTLLVNNSFNTGSGTIVNSGGVLGGGGSIGGDVQNSGGTVAPGNSPGTLTVDGNYNQGSSGTLAIEIGGTQAGVDHDVLNVLGDASLAGTLSVSLIDGFTPSGGNTFKVLTASGGLTDAGLTLGGSDAGSFTMSIDTANDWIMLITAGAGLAGDYNGNGTVDAADYTFFRDNLGSDSAVLNGNGSGAATVVQADYDLWKQNFGSSGTGSSAAVPEPSSLALMLLIGHAAIALRKRSMA